MHKGNIMKYTEGAFRKWGYEVAAEEFPDSTITEEEVWERCGGEIPQGKVMINDRIADIMFQHVLTRPREFEVIATSNLNGDYLSDACAAQVGGVGVAPGANLGDEIGLFEATHGTAPSHADKDEANPTALILSGVLMLEHLGWWEAAGLIKDALAETFQEKLVTYDLARQLEGAKQLPTSKFAEKVIERM
jgi:isocitrate dehydrogenase